MLEPVALAEQSPWSVVLCHHDGTTQVRFFNNRGSAKLFLALIPVMQEMETVEFMSVASARLARLGVGLN